MTLTLEEMRANRHKWVEALRSGKFKQARGTLVNGNSYCCLGVLARCAGIKKKSISGGHETLNDFPLAVEWVGLRSPAGWYAINSCGLADKNDSGATFSEIADIIESEPPGLFIDATRSDNQL